MKQIRSININNIKPENYASFGIALMVLRMHNWECKSIINGQLRMTRSIENDDLAAEPDDAFYDGIDNTFNDLN
jgi:hypothetical protein|tara:strand:+ start:886 stop:1107 length:222 start_codon:yes stop_codon:yes gene_type:complete